ncbi:MAG: hypothetical protein ACRDG4_17590 [Chloroflexota bacterium]
MPRYTSYLLRVWRSSRHDRVQWSARLEDLQAGSREQFTSADALLNHLRLLLDPDAPSGPDPPEHTEIPGDRF